MVGTPFDEILVRLTTYIFLNTTNPNQLVNLICEQLQILRNIYLRMREIDFNKKNFSQSPGIRRLTMEESALDIPSDVTKVKIDYSEFLFILNQFGRVLERRNYVKNSSMLPLFKRIRFYRNCVVEHWEEYTEVMVGNGFTFSLLKAPIPIVEGTYAERMNIKKDLEDAFLRKRIRIRIPRKYSVYNMVSNQLGYCEYFYHKLECINSELHTKYGSNKIPAEIIELLFKFGFPAPITDIEKYVDRLVYLLYRIIKRHKIILPV